MKNIKLSNVRKTTWLWFIILVVWNVKLLMDFINETPNEASYFWGPFTLVLVSISVIWQLFHGEE